MNFIDINSANTKRYQKIIIHYDNLERITNTELLHKLLYNLRDFFQIKDIIFIFVGDARLSTAIDRKPQLNSIFSKAFFVVNFNLNTTKKIIQKRIESEKAPNEIFINPIEENVIEELYKIHKKNLRHILNSLSECILAKKVTNIPNTLSLYEAKFILYNKVLTEHIDKIGRNETEIFEYIIKNDIDIFYPAEIAEALKKDKANTTNIYFRNLMNNFIIIFVKKEDKKNYFMLTKEMAWYKLKPTEAEQKEVRKENYDKSLYEINLYMIF